MNSLTISESRYVNIEALKQSLRNIIEDMNVNIQHKLGDIEGVYKGQQLSAKNLVQYLTLRSKDIRSLQDDLHVAGLSSLASSESHIQRQLQEILQRTGEEIAPADVSVCDYYKAKGLLNFRSKQLFGSKPDSLIPYLMITFDKKFIGDYHLVKELLEAGMNIARINCAHDDREKWKGMIDLVKEASAKTGIPCKIYMDLGGAKLRTKILGKGKKKQKVKLEEGKLLFLAEQYADYDDKEIVIGCDEPNMISQVKPGERIVFDDGLVEIVAISSRQGIVEAKVLRVSSKKKKLTEGKGINFPETRLKLPALTENDRIDLSFICEYADLVGFSFIRHASDLKELQQELNIYTRRPKIILKIETSDAVINLPSLLMQGMKEDVFGVMIARGDLAVEIGFERMSEIQEEILWISEAAHVPVIWATQVLETLNKSGVATRSEITDASFAAHSECVMINKGDYILDVLETLTDILRRSGGHHAKKRYTLRPMQIASTYLEHN